ncbi:MAG TPA: SDR family oxidoreductase [Tepidisphaeraceae bacterium]|jgi:NAD(P)-dependent dehydrogenase (short-subunit alcohol dehydrogenase family)
MQLGSFELSGKVALLTGAGRGIGLAIAKAFAAAGCAVAIQDIDESVAQSEVDQLMHEGHRALALGGDLTDLALPKQLVGQTIAQLGGLHILVNNGAIQFRKHWAELSLEDFEKILHADVWVPLRLSQLVAPIFKQQKWGRIINIGSIQQIDGNPFMLPYSMGKAALMNQTVALAKDLGHDNVTVNLIAPGYFDTLRNEKNFTSEEDKVRVAQKYPVPRLGQPEDCAGVALLLASEAGSYITGQSLHVDGGISL